MDDIERNSPIESIQPIRKIGARIYDRERRDLRNPYEKNQRGLTTKRKKPSIKPAEPLTADGTTTEALEQDFTDYKSGLKTRLAFDRAQILQDEPSSN